MNDNQQNTLESSENVLETEQPVTEPIVAPMAQSAADQSAGSPSQNQTNPKTGPPKKTIGDIKRSLYQKIHDLSTKVNIYVLVFVLILLLASIAAFATYRSSKNASKSSNINSQNLSASDLQNLKNNNTTVGDAKDTLTIASNSIFNGRVLVKSDLDIAGTVRIGGAISLSSSMSVSGTSKFDDLQITSNLAVAGNAAVQGTLSLQKNLTVGGGASFAGTIYAPTINVDSFVINKDLTISRHIDTNGNSARVSGGGGLGGGGTVSISGTDTAGTVNVNFGSGPAAGVLAYVTFANSFGQTPHVVITPVGSSCASLNYYVGRNTTGFTIATTSAGSAGTSCSFDYIALD